MRPETVRELVEVITTRDGPAPDYISRGLGRSYADPALNDGGGVILHERLNRILRFDDSTGVVEAEGGATFASLIEVFLPRGWFLPVTPGTRYITVGGAIAADVHGKNHHRDGSIGRFVLDFELLTGAGEIIHCSREQNADVFRATIGGMGLTGAIISARFRLQRVDSAYLTVDYERASNIDHALELFAADDQRYRYSVAWVDCLAGGVSLGRSLLSRGDHTPADRLPPHLGAGALEPGPRRRMSLPPTLPSFVLSPVTVRTFNGWLYRSHRDRQKIVDYNTFFYPLDTVLNWNRLYGRRGLVQYQVVLPLETGRAGLVELLEKLAKSSQESFLGVLKAFGPQGEGLLSFPQRGYCLALDVPYSGTGVLDFMRGLDLIALRHGGRVYLAKDACTRRETFEAMYPRTDEFKAIRRRIDPASRFSSSQARRIGLAEARRPGSA